MNHITVIDIQIGTPNKGYAIRIGPEVHPKIRLANCYNESTNSLVKFSNMQYMPGANSYSVYNTIQAAIQAAIQVRDVFYKNYTVRVDATIG